MNETANAVPTEVTQDERTMAILAHVLQVIGWWIAPLVIFIIKGNSKFVSFHALQALFLQILHMLFSGVVMVVFFVFIFASVFHGGQAAQHAPPIALFVAFPLIWLAMMGMWVLILVVAIVYGVKAGGGEWAEYPVLGGLTRKILGIGPRGASLQG